MKTRQDAEAKLAELALQTAVGVADFTDSQGNRRRFTYTPVGGRGTVDIEIDADPSPEQLETLANNLPVPDAKREETVEKLVPTKTADADPVDVAVAVKTP